MQELLGQPLVQNALRRLDHDPKRILDRVSSVEKETILPMHFLEIFSPSL